MINWSRKHTLVAGAALILATNAVALIGVAYNRSGEPTSVLTLSERELRMPYRYGWREETSGLEIGLDWRVLSGNPDDEYSLGRHAPAWLDEAKLASLGVDVRPRAPRADRYYRDLPQKAVLVVLELNGPAFEEALRRAQARAEKDAALAAAEPGRAHLEQKAKRTAGIAQREMADTTRLFAVDAGLEYAPLRAKYPDATRYAVVRGLVRPMRVVAHGETRYTASLSDLSAGRVNVPLEFGAAFERTRTVPGLRPDAKLAVTIAFGQRFEPWIVGASGTRK